MGGRHAHLYKDKRVRKRDLITNKFQVPPNSSGNRPRAPYFRRFRAERTALRVLENTFPKTFDKKEYRAVRFLYYLVIPHLSKYLWYGPDRDRLLLMESDYYNMLLSYHYRNNRVINPMRIYVPRIQSV